MKTTSKRIKGNVESDVKITRNLVIFNTVVVIIIIACIIIGVIFLVNYLSPYASQFSQLSSFFSHT